MIELLYGTRVRVTKHSVEAILHRPEHHGSELDKQGLIHLREYLPRVGMTQLSHEAT